MLFLFTNQFINQISLPGLNIQTSVLPDLNEWTIKIGTLNPYFTYNPSIKRKK